MPVEPIRVELESFCQQFTCALEPFSEALDQGTAALRETSDGDLLHTLLGDLQDNRHRLQILLDKARQQNTYLVIFGPLKSGKSTLMNAISGAYVSEVTSLPAYPCLVYVREGESHGFSTTAFNGDHKQYASRGELHASLQTAHQALAQRLREADAAGTPFNPAQDFTEAVRRIDFTMPAPYLRESGTILVDTPGLYTKMKYNYGQLTRDFRDTAACAVFVVKTDNLFFEQVFEEFADLLKVFSRVFLVVNIDSSKQDLGPDGRLEPSLERRDPKRIIEAFENLTVSAQIRSAIDSGRLRIYLIDLLQTAMQSLQTGNPALPPETADDAAANTRAEGSDNATDPGPRLGFETFLNDLTDYINSSEYIIEFMSDSLRQADSILREVRQSTCAPEMADFRAGIANLEAQAEASLRQMQTLEHLRGHDWSGPLEALSAEIRQQVTEHAGSVLPQLVQQLHHEVTAWTESDESMQELVETRIAAKIREVCRHARTRAIEIFDHACRDRNSGVRIEGEVSHQLQALELSFDDIYTAFQPTIRAQFEAEPELPAAAGLQETLPLRRRLIDWMLFRSAARVRQCVFGAENPSAQTFTARAKAKRLNEAGIHEFCGMVGDYARECNLFALQDVLESLLRQYRDAFLADAHQRIEARQQQLRSEYGGLKDQLELRQEVLRALDTMEAASDQLEAQVGQLQHRFIPHQAVFDLDKDELEVRHPTSENTSDSASN